MDPFGIGTDKCFQVNSQRLQRTTYVVCQDVSSPVVILLVDTTAILLEQNRF